MLAYDITETEYVLLCAMYYRNLDEEMPNLISIYARKWGVTSGLRQLMYPDEKKLELVKKGLLEQIDDRFILTDKFLDLFVLELVAGNELIDLYPSFVVINGINTPLKTSSRMELRKKYWEAIGGHRKEHAEVIKDVKYGIANNLINMNITKFIESEFWRDIRKLRIEEKTSSIIPEDF